MPCAALEIGRISVYSAQGEPLDATVPILLGAGETIDEGCLSLGTQRDFPNPDHMLLRAARLSLAGSQGPIRIATTEPIRAPAVSMALRVRCASGFQTLRLLNVQLPAPAAAASPPANRTPVNPALFDSTLPGTTITVRRGDSVYGLSRMIYPHNEKAVADLARSIVLANPQLFPDGRGRPLRVGEQLTIPDLRTVEKIIASASVAAAASKRAAATANDAITPTRQEARRGPTQQQPASGRNKRQRVASAATGDSAAVPAQTVAASGKLRLKLARSLDLTRTTGMTEEKRAKLRAQAAAATRPAETGLREEKQLSSRISRVRDIQEAIDSRITQLEAMVTALRKADVGAQIKRPAAQAPQTAATSAQSTKLPVDMLPDAAQAQHPVSPRWQWLGAGALAILLAFGALFGGRRLHAYRKLARQRSHIDAMLGQARSEATSLLGTGSTATAGSATQRVSSRREAHADAAGTEQQRASQRPRSAPEGSLYIPVVEPPAQAASPGSGEPSQRLRMEMDKALDSTRSMFSDVDRFITLGRTQNAISLLEFQIKRNPRDRPAWIKLMAVYRYQGMDADFDRTYAAFREQFGDELGS